MASQAGQTTTSPVEVAILLIPWLCTLASPFLGGGSCFWIWLALPPYDCTRVLLVGMPPRMLQDMLGTAINGCTRVFLVGMLSTMLLWLALQILLQYTLVLLGVFSCTTRAAQVPEFLYILAARSAQPNLFPYTRPDGVMHVDLRVIHGQRWRTRCWQQQGLRVWRWIW